MPALDVPGDDLRYHLILQPETSAVLQKSAPMAGGIGSEVKECIDNRSHHSLRKDA